jgi:hypothetical protein
MNKDLIHIKNEWLYVIVMKYPIVSQVSHISACCW